MERDTILTAWVEAQIDSDGIALSLISESPDTGAVIEDVEHFTFEELQEMEGEMFTMNLGESAEEALSEMREDANTGRILQAGDLSKKAEELPDEPSSQELLAYMGFIDDRPESEIRTGYKLPDVGDVMRDTGDLPSWSEDDRVRVINVTETPASEYELDTDDWGKETVADYNPSEPEDAPVVVANYIGSESEYAFPCTRLEPVDSDDSKGPAYVLDEEGNAPGVDI